MANEVNVFKAEDFGDVALPNGHFYHCAVDAHTKNQLAQLFNEMLVKRLTKYYGAYDTERSDCPFICASFYDLELDTHIVYGLEPQPIKKEPVKVEFETTVSDVGTIHTGLEIYSRLKGKKIKVTVEELS